MEATLRRGDANFAGQRRDALDVAGLREHVERLQAEASVAGRAQHRQIGGLRLGIARDVDDRARREGGELAQEIGAAPFARWIDDHRSVSGGEGDRGEHGAGVGGEELAVGASVADGVGARPTDGARAHLDAEHPLEARRGAESEEAAAAVGVDKEPRAAGLRFGGDVRGQLREQEGVVLEEVAGQELQRQLADLFGDHRARIDGDARGGLAHQQRGAIAIARPAGVHLGAQLGEAGVHRGHRDRAGGNVERPARQPDFEEADRHRAIGARPRKVRRQLRPIAVGARRRQAVGHGALGEERPNSFGLEGQLLVVRQILQLAATAAPEQRAEGDGRPRRFSGHGQGDYPI